MEAPEAYRECMRNHAATLGTYATDGCGEYTPADPASPTELRCAACGCHRNFHRKVPLYGPSSPRLPPAEEYRSSSASEAGNRRTRTRFTSEQKDRMLRFAERIGWRLPRRDGGVDEVGEFCREIGVGRNVFKVWMHNHKGNGSSSPASSASTATTATLTTVTTADAN